MHAKKTICTFSACPKYFYLSYIYILFTCTRSYIINTDYPLYRPCAFRRKCLKGCPKDFPSFPAVRRINKVPSPGPDLLGSLGVTYDDLRPCFYNDFLASSWDPIFLILVPTWLQLGSNLAPISIDPSVGAITFPGEGLPSP